MPQRMTMPTLAVLRVLLTDQTAERYGLEIGDAVGLPSGTVHPILARLERAGWVSSRWEDGDPAALGRPTRRYYRLTDDGRHSALEAVVRADARLRPARLRLATEQP